MVHIFVFYVLVIFVTDKVIAFNVLINSVTDAEIVLYVKLNMFNVLIIFVGDTGLMPLFFSVADERAIVSRNVPKTDFFKAGNIYTRPRIRVIAHLI